MQPNEFERNDIDGEIAGTDTYGYVEREALKDVSDGASRYEENIDERNHAELNRADIRRRGIHSSGSGTEGAQLTLFTRKLVDDDIVTTPSDYDYGASLMNLKGTIMEKALDEILMVSPSKERMKALPTDAQDMKDILKRGTPPHSVGMKLSKEDFERIMEQARKAQR